MTPTGSVPSFCNRAVLATVAILALLLSAQDVIAFETFWANQYGNLYTNSASAIATCADGGAIVAGSFAGNLTLGNNYFSGFQGYQTFIGRWDQSGDVVWSLASGGVMSGPGGVAVDHAGNVFLAGGFQRRAISFGGEILENLVWANDVFLVKLDADGHNLWSAQYGDDSAQSPRDITVDSSGNVVMVGQFEGTIDFGGAALASVGGDDIFVAKLDPGGDHIWSKRFGGADDDLVMSVAIDGAGNVILAGWLAGSVDFGGGAIDSAGGWDAFLVKLDPAGNHLWSTGFGSALDDYAGGVAVDASGNIWLAGTFQGEVDFGGGSLLSAGGRDVFVTKFNSAGLHLLSRRFGGAGDDYGSQAVVDAVGNVVLAGNFQGTVDFGGGDLTSAGGTDGYLAMLDALGGHVESLGVGGPENVYPTSAVGVNASGSVLAAGYFEGSLDVGGIILQSDQGSRDICIAKFTIASRGGIEASVRTQTTDLPRLGAEVALRNHVGEFVAREVTDAGGIAHFDGLAPGEYLLKARVGDRTSGAWTGVAVLPDASTPCDLRVPAGTYLKGTVRDAWSGMVVRGATVELQDASGPTGITDLTDAQGSYSFEVSGGEAYSVEVGMRTPFRGQWRDAYATSVSEDVYASPEVATIIPDVQLSSRTVVLVHGINSSSAAAWRNAAGNFSDALSSAGWLAIDDIDLPGEGPQAGTKGTATIASQAEYLETVVWRDLIDAGIRSFWIVAHSQGGVVARWMIERGSTEGADRNPLFESMVPGLITIGTPHHGSPLSRNEFVVQKSVCDVDGSWDLNGFNCPDQWEGLDGAALIEAAWLAYPALRDLNPDSAFLRMLNRRSESEGDWSLGLCTNSILPEVVLIEEGVVGRPRYASIASVWDPDRDRVEALVARDGLVALSGCEYSDAVVPTWSSQLHAQNAGSSRAENYISLGPWHSELTLSPGIQEFVVDQLLSVSPGAWPPGNPRQPVDPRREVPAAWETVTNEAFVVASQDTVTRDLQVGASDSLRVRWIPTTGAAEVSLLSPSGAVVDSIHALLDPDLRFGPSPDGGWEYVVGHPEPGQWGVVGRNQDLAIADRIVWTAYEMDGVALQLSARAESPTDHVVEAIISGPGGSPLGATVSGALVGPSGLPTQVLFLDDGVLPDLQAGDLVYTGRISLEPEFGPSVLAVSAEGDQANPFLRAKLVSFEHAATSDPAISSPGLRLSSLSAAEAAPVAIAAMVQNSGADPATIESRVVLAETMETVSLDTLVLDPGETVELKAEHVPLWTGEFEYALTLKVLDDVLDADPLNNFATATIRIGEAVTAVPECAGGGGAPAMPAESVRIDRISPNPFNPRVTVRFSNRVPGRIRLDAFDLRGRHVRTVVDEDLAPGAHRAVWDGRDDAGARIASGVYFLRIAGGGAVDVRKVMLLK